MKVTLTQANIEAGVRLFLQSQGMNPEKATVAFATTRKPTAQIIAEVDLLGALPEAPVCEPVAKLTAGEAAGKSEGKKAAAKVDPVEPVPAEPEVEKTAADTDPAGPEIPAEPAPVGESLFN